MSCHVMSCQSCHIISYHIKLYYIMLFSNLMTGTFWLTRCVWLCVWRDYTLYTVCNFTSFVLTVFMASSAWQLLLRHFCTYQFQPDSVDVNNHAKGQLFFGCCSANHTSLGVKIATSVHHFSSQNKWAAAVTVGREVATFGTELKMID